MRKKFQPNIWRNQIPDLICSGRQTYFKCQIVSMVVESANKTGNMPELA